MKKIYLVSILCLFAFSLAFSKCGCGDPNCGGCSTKSSSQSSGQDWRSCCKCCDCTKMGCDCHGCDSGIPEDAFVEQGSGEPAPECTCCECACGKCEECK